MDNENPALLDSDEEPLSSFDFDVEIVCFHLFQVDPPVEKAYSPGDSLKNLGPSATYTGRALVALGNLLMKILKTRDFP